MNGAEMLWALVVTFAKTFVAAFAARPVFMVAFVVWLFALTAAVWMGLDRRNWHAAAWGVAFVVSFALWLAIA